MGWSTHHSITVTSWDPNHLEKAREHILQLVGPVEPIVWVSDLSALGVNGQRTFFIAPDGSKEGWPESNLGDTMRKQITDWLKAQSYDDGSTSLQWIEYSFGGDDDYEGGPQIIDSSHHQRKRMREEEKMRETKRAEPVEPPLDPAGSSPTDAEILDWSHDQW